MLHSIYNTTIGLPNIHKLIISIADSESRLVFEVEVTRKVGEEPAKTVTMEVTPEQVDIIMRLAGMPFKLGEKTP